jgi:hypothetical protein
MNELEQRKLKYDIVFYHMEGCYYCRMANDELDPLIKAGIIPASGIIGKFAPTDNPPPGVQGFPHFVNNKNGKTITGWPGSKQALYDKLDYKEPVPVPVLTEPFKPLQRNTLEKPVRSTLTDIFIPKNPKNPNKREYFSENYEPESMPSYPVVQSMEPIPQSIHYYHDVGAGYSKLSNCWVKRPNYTA